MLSEFSVNLRFFGNSFIRLPVYSLSVTRGLIDLISDIESKNTTDTE